MKILQTFDNLDYEITEQQATQIMEQSTTGKAGGIWINGDYIHFSQIKGITKATEYEQPKIEAKGIGLSGIISLAKRKSAIEALAKGLKKAKIKLEAKGQTAKNIEELLKLARIRYAQIK